MATSFALSEAGYLPTELRVTAAVDLSSTNGQFAIASISLKLQARVPKIDRETFAAIAEAAERGCPISKALSATPITLESDLITG